MYIGYINYFWCDLFYVVVVSFCVVGGYVNAQVLYFAIYLVYIKLFSGFSLDLP